MTHISQLNETNQSINQKINIRGQVICLVCLNFDFEYGLTC